MRNRGFPVRAVLAWVWLLAGAANAPAQAVDATRVGDNVNLAGDWRFHKGDDAAWAQPGFDDSQWPLVSTIKSWREQGLSGYSGLFWYRLHVRIPSDSRKLALLIRDGATSYEVFAGGVKVGDFGGMPPHAKAVGARMQYFGIPDQRGRREVVIALRFWEWPVYADFNSGGPRGKRGVVIGTLANVESEFESGLRAEQVQWMPEVVVIGFALAVAFGLILLYRLQPQHGEYLWLALTLLFSWGLAPMLDGLKHFYRVEILAGDCSQILLEQIGQLALIQFIVEFLQMRKGWAIRIYQITLPLLTVLVLCYPLLHVPVQAINAFGLIYSLPLGLGIPLLLLIHARRGNREAGFLFVSMILSSGNAILLELGSLLNQLGFVDAAQRLRIPPFSIAGIDVDFDNLADLSFILSVCLVVLYRYGSTERERVRAVSELEAARSVQSLMIPRVAPEIPGFTVESFYLPAQEVGGDFFQVLSVAGGAVLAVVGDVSGKGLRAAMVVSMLVGVLRDVTMESASPAEILRRLNRSLVTGGHEGFVTCVAVLVERDGTVRAANAGHLAPYCNGLELDVANGLPLGVVADAEYAETVHRVEAGDRLWLISDGVVEARNASGGLFGFERTAERLGRSRSVAEAIPEEEFVADDDMTVLVVRRD